MIGNIFMAFALGIFMMLGLLCLYFGAPIWALLLAAAFSPLLSLVVLFLVGTLVDFFERRARAKRRAAAAARRAKGEAL